MADRYGRNRYGNRSYGRDDERRGDYGRRRSGSDYDIDRSGSSRFGGYDYDREENYFGGGGSLGYGTGYSGMSYDRGFSSYNRDFEEDYGDTGRSSRSSRGNFGRGRDFDRGSYSGRGYRRDDDYDRSRFGGYSGGYSGGRGYSSDRSYGGRGYDRDYYNDDDRGYRGEYGYDRDDRGWFDKAADEVASWFGDEEAERRRRMDERRQGHRGRGPRNYTRSDERIKEDINDRLTDDFYLDASDIDVEVNDGEVTLTGSVDSRFAKRRAEDIAEDVSGVSHMENRLRVKENFYEQDSSYTDTTTDSKTDTTTTTAKSRSKTA